MKEQNFLIKFATRGRPEYFKKAVRNIFATSKNKNFHLLITADVDDELMFTEEIQLFVHQFNLEVNYLYVDPGFTISIIYGKSESKIHACNRDMEYANPNWTVLLNMSDDFYFPEGQYWDELIETKIDKVFHGSLDCFLHFNDGVVGDALATMSVLGREYFERDHYIYNPGYKSFSADAESYFVARARGAHHYFSEVLALHQHPAHRPDPKDRTYAVNSLATPEDLAFYWERLNSDFGLKIEGTPLWQRYKK